MKIGIGMPQEMSRAVERVKAALDHQNQQTLVRGELWVGRRPFQELRIDNSLAGHLRLRNRLGMDLLFLPVSVPDFSFSSMDYQRFSVTEIEEAVKISNLFVAVIVDGPFQRLVEKQGLLPLLAELKDDEKGVTGRFDEEAADIAALLKECLALNVGAVVVADDLAYQHSTYISPDDSEKLLGSIYSDAVTCIHAGGAYALFHSCGNITALLPQLVACGFDGLAACQSQCLDLVSLKRVYGSQLTFLSGMDADILEAGSLTASQKEEFVNRVMSLARGGGFILSSSCGLYSLNSLQRLEELYSILEDHLGR
jgi:uroporphyrinogen decarboxylase